MKTKVKNSILAVALACFALSGCAKKVDIEAPATLKSALESKFYIGTALNQSQFTGQDTAGIRIIKEQFSAVVPENCMKSEVIHPEENRYDFTQADQFVAFGEANNLFITGHCLIWHSQTPPWFFVDATGKDVSKEVLIERMKNHITTIVSRYKGKIKGWDVVNEAIMDDGSYRESKFYTIIGEEFIPLAFQFAHEADPDVELYYNDYSMTFEGKRSGVVALVKSLQEKGLRIDAVGMQGHIGMDYPEIDEFEKSLLAYAALGVNVMITELDLTVLPHPGGHVGADVAQTAEYKQEMNPYADGLPADVDAAWTARFNDFFKLFFKHQDKITRVTLWGVSDGDSWRNNWPVPGRTDYALLFDRNHQPKPIVNLIINEATKK
ncbi:MAG: endo-1,4-beta-xylanase [Candidatus Symbiothrix sp.]|jgi:endo-1,4-beta-xylanase|nr:endo-1,4-beta-xylanase [Candidatus Symbiothrix sp.]